MISKLSRKDIKSSKGNIEDWQKININFESNDISKSISENLKSLSKVTTEYSYLFDAFSGNSFSKQLKLEGEITQLRGRLKETIDELNRLKENDDNNEKQIEELKKIQVELSMKESLNHILPRICEKARTLILDSEKFRNEFKNLRTCQAVVVSIDIRRSTELMLKARTPQLYSKFITTLSNKLSDIIISNFGVFDKFTGDGILAFFPTFYSGNNAILRAIIAADQCHQVFEEHYLNSKDSFNIFIKDIGLGVGIDFGDVSLVNEHNEITVVGVPVVYACRLSSTHAGTTILNLAAKKSLENHLSGHAIYTAIDIPIKNEGTAVAYTASLDFKSIELDAPNWYYSEENK